MHFGMYLATGSLESLRVTTKFMLSDLDPTCTAQIQRSVFSSSHRYILFKRYLW